VKLHNFEIQLSKAAPPPPAPEGWIRQWHGYFQMEKVRSNRKLIANRRNYQHAREGILKESQVERLYFLNIVKEINKDCINMLELGAGRGDWCLSLAGVVDHKIVPCQADRYRCLAVEAEPTHFEWTREHFERQCINGTAVHGAVGGHDGSCMFYAVADPADNYGQHINDEKGNLNVPCYSIATLCKKYGFEHIDILHMDIQGAEVDAIEGLLPHLDRLPIDYFMIGTHKTGEINERIIGMLSVAYKVLADISPRAGEVMTDFGEAYFPVDGMLVLRRNGLQAIGRV